MLRLFFVLVLIMTANAYAHTEILEDQSVKSLKYIKFDGQQVELIEDSFATASDTGFCYFNSSICDGEANAMVTKRVCFDQYQGLSWFSGGRCIQR